MSFCKQHKYKLIFAAVTIIVIALCVAYFFIIRAKISSPEERGTFGDMFGAVGALFSGLAFAGVIVTMLQQKEELELQRQEISQTNRELELQRREMNEQNRSIMLQRFENTFFNMLETLQKILADITVYDEVTHHRYSSEKPEEWRTRDELHGRAALSKFWYYFCVAWENDGELTITIQHFRNYISKNRHIIPYFRQIFQILAFVDRSNILTLEEKYNYSCILRETLSSDEISLLFYYVISRNGNQPFKQLIEKYAIFIHINESTLINPNHRNIYSDGAYRITQNDTE